MFLHTWKFNPLKIEWTLNGPIQKPTNKLEIKSEQNHFDRKNNTWIATVSKKSNW